MRNVPDLNQRELKYFLIVMAKVPHFHPYSV